MASAVLPLTPRLQPLPGSVPVQERPLFRGGRPQPRQPLSIYQRLRVNGGSVFALSGLGALMALCLAVSGSLVLELGPNDDCKSGHRKQFIVGFVAINYLYLFTVMFVVLDIIGPWRKAIRQSTEEAERQWRRMRGIGEEKCVMFSDSEAIFNTQTFWHDPDILLAWSGLVYLIVSVAWIVRGLSWQNAENNCTDSALFHYSTFASLTCLLLLCVAFIIILVQLASSRGDRESYPSHLPVEPPKLITTLIQQYEAQVVASKASVGASGPIPSLPREELKETNKDISPTRKDLVGTEVVVPVRAPPSPVATLTLPGSVPIPAEETTKALEQMQKFFEEQRRREQDSVGNLVVQVQSLSEQNRALRAEQEMALKRAAEAAQLVENIAKRAAQLDSTVSGAAATLAKVQQERDLGPKLQVQTPAPVNTFAAEVEITKRVQAVDDEAEERLRAAAEQRKQRELDRAKAKEEEALLLQRLVAEKRRREEEEKQKQDEQRRKEEVEKNERSAASAEPKRAHHRVRITDQRLPPLQPIKLDHDVPNGPICQRCITDGAVVECVQCGIDYCQACFDIMHKSKKTRDHKASIIRNDVNVFSGNAPCGVCASTVAHTRCDTCDAVFCGNCFRQRHRSVRDMEHKTLNLLPHRRPVSAPALATAVRQTKLNTPGPVSVSSTALKTAGTAMAKVDGGFTISDDPPVVQPLVKHVSAAAAGTASNPTSRAGRVPNNSDFTISSDPPTAQPLVKVLADKSVINASQLVNATPASSLGSGFTISDDPPSSQPLVKGTALATKTTGSSEAAVKTNASADFVISDDPPAAQPLVKSAAPLVHPAAKSSANAEFTISDDPPISQPLVKQTASAVATAALSGPSAAVATVASVHKSAPLSDPAQAFTISADPPAAQPLIKHTASGATAVVAPSAAAVLPLTSTSTASPMQKPENGFTISSDPPASQPLIKTPVTSAQQQQQQQQQQKQGSSPQRSMRSGSNSDDFAIADDPPAVQPLIKVSGTSSLPVQEAAPVNPAPDTRSSGSSRSGEFTIANDPPSQLPLVKGSMQGAPALAPSSATLVGPASRSLPPLQAKSLPSLGQPEQSLSRAASPAAEAFTIAGDPPESQPLVKVSLR